MSYNKIEETVQDFIDRYPYLKNEYEDLVASDIVDWLRITLTQMADDARKEENTPIKCSCSHHVTTDEKKFLEEKGKDIADGYHMGYAEARSAILSEFKREVENIRDIKMDDLSARVNNRTLNAVLAVIEKKQGKKKWFECCESCKPKGFECRDSACPLCHFADTDAGGNVE